MREERERGRRGRGGERSERGFFFCFGSDDFFSLSFASLVALSLFQGPDRRARDRTTPEPTREAKALLGTWSPLLFLSHSLFNQFSPWRASPRRPLPPRAPCFSPTPGRIASLPRRPGPRVPRRDSSAGASRAERARATRRRARARKTTMTKQRWQRGDEVDDALGFVVAQQQQRPPREQRSTPGRSIPSRGCTAASWPGASSSRPAWFGVARRSWLCECQTKIEKRRRRVKE